MNHLGRNVCRLMGVVVALALSSPAGAFVVDDFSAGQFNLQATGGISTGNGGQDCLSFCMALARQVHLSAAQPGAVATTQLVAPPGHAQTVMPVGGGIVSFAYQLFGGQKVNITEGGTATQFEVWFTAFEPGALMDVYLTDINDVNEFHSITPTFATPPTQLLPGIAAIPLSTFVTVDLTQIKTVMVAVNSTSGIQGTYSITLITVPGSVAVTWTTFGEPDTAGQPYPTFPPIDLRWEALPVPGPIIDITLGLDDVQDETGTQVNAAVHGTPDGTASFFETTFESPADNPIVTYSFDFIPVQITPIIPIQIMPVTLSPTQDYAEVIAHQPVTGGVWEWRLYIEPTQPVGLANVTAVVGSAVVTVEISGTVDTGSPALRMAMAGTFTPIAAVPGIVSPWALTALVSALTATGGGWLLRTRSRFA